MACLRAFETAAHGRIRGVRFTMFLPAVPFCPINLAVFIAGAGARCAGRVFIQLAAIAGVIENVIFI